MSGNLVDLNLTMGGDLVLSPTGDIGTVSGTTRGEQRVLRRLLTNPGDYIFHLDYGGGLAAMIGMPADALFISGIIRGQMSKEAVVTQSPAPSITVQVDTAGDVTANILYQDADTGETGQLTLPPD